MITRVGLSKSKALAFIRGHCEQSDTQNVQGHEDPTHGVVHKLLHARAHTLYSFVLIMSLY